jgi:hypothetical protein
MNIKQKAIASLVTAAALTVGGMTVSAQYGQNDRQGRGRNYNANMLSGTYELDRNQGDDPARAAENATRRMPAAQRDNAYRMLLGRLQPPATLSIERRGRTVQMASNNGPMTTFEADGQTHREEVINQTDSYGRPGRAATMATRATFVGDRLTITSQGNRATDFTVTFEPLQNGDRMVVTRQIYNANYSTPVRTRAYYTRTSNQPRWDLYNGSSTSTYDPRNSTYDPRYNPRDNRNGNVSLVVPEGTRLNAVLDTAIDTRTAREGDRFTLTVQSPNEYRDARIEGVIRSTTSYSTDHPADLRVAFDTIRLRNGQSAPIDATLETVRKPGGDVLQVDGTVRDDKQTNTIQTGAIGAAIGGVIGVLAGGAKGAAIGAVLGGAAGAGGAILANQRDRYLDLPVGTEVTIVTGYRSTGGLK